ncbi:unnamed protein product [Pleuronectes platessa]|uniref:Uncharacterized protein n=1 Tax=Pleuronectes platessa TaxID=8262 RepID=A0A9N7UUV5_PLEPL|nr:unnamed protein product [Pleuronectes platessa]
MNREQVCLVRCSQEPATPPATHNLHRENEKGRRRDNKQQHQTQNLTSASEGYVITGKTHASISSTLLFYEGQFGVQHLAQGHFGTQMGKTGDRTAELQVGGRPLYPSATAADGSVQLANYPRPGRGCHIRARSSRTMDYDLWIAHQRSQWLIQYGGFYLCGLIVVVMGDPVSRWHQIMVVDQDRGGG